MAVVQKGRFTFRFAAVLFGLSAIWDLLTVQGETILFGQVVGGMAVAIYHLIYVVLFAWLAFGPQRPAEAPIAKAQPPAVSLPAQANDYLLAHQGFSPRVSLLGMAPYVRTVAEYPAEKAK